MKRFLLVFCCCGTKNPFHFVRMIIVFVRFVSFLPKLGLFAFGAYSYLGHFQMDSINRIHSRCNLTKNGKNIKPWIFLEFTHTHNTHMQFSMRHTQIPRDRRSLRNMQHMKYSKNCGSSNQWSLVMIMIFKLKTTLDFWFVFSLRWFLFRIPRTKCQTKHWKEQFRWFFTRYTLRLHRSEKNCKPLRTPAVCFIHWWGIPKTICYIHSVDFVRILVFFFSLLQKLANGRPLLFYVSV